jgi:predicted permease
MYARLFTIIAPLLISSAVGFAWTRLKRPFDMGFVTRLIMDVGMPFLIVSSLATTGVERGALADVGLAVICLLAVVALVGFLLLRLLRMDVRAFLSSILFPNTGNMGLPLCLFAFGREGLSLGLVFFAATSITHFTFGLALVSGSAHPRQFLTNPIVWSTAIGLGFLLTGWKLPTWVANTADIMAGLAIPLMLLALGVSLANLKTHAAAKSAILTVARLGIGFGLGLLAAEVFGLTGVARGVLVLQSTMPVAVFNYLLAERYGREPDAVAGAVVASTIVSFVTLPLLLWYLLAG